MTNKIKTLFSAFLFIVSHGSNSGVAIYDSLGKTVPSLINLKDKNMLEMATTYQAQEKQVRGLVTTPLISATPETPDSSVLDEVVMVSINNNLLLLALEKILPKGWRVVLSDDSQDLAIKTVSVVSEDSKREMVIKKILTDIGAQGFFYKKLKLLVVSSHQIIK